MRKIILAASAAIVMFACSGDRVGSNTEVAGTKATDVQKEKIYGVAQKGPFVNGNVVIYELDDKYEKTGKTFKGKTNDKGYFGIDITGGKLASPYIIIEASGKYVNEVTGKTTDNAITLKSVADVSNKENVNVNVLTDLESDKVIKLAQSGKSFEDAKTQAQKEVFTSLGISESSVTRNSEDIALFGGNSSDSVLLVVSVSLQGNKTEEEVAGLLANLSGSGTFDVEKGLKDANVDMGKVKDNILKVEPSAVVPNISGTTPKAPTTNTTTNTSTSRPTTPSTSTPSYTPPAAQPAPTPAPPPVVITEKEKPICSETVTTNCVLKCFNKDYNPETQFCTRSPSNPQVVEKCGGKGYDTGTKICVDGKIEETNLFRDARDGKKYKYVKIGEQVWMAENLNYAAEGSKCVNSDKTLNDANTAACDTYGRLYDWETAMGGLASSDANPSNIQGVCPAGWHLPSNAEWKTLTDFVGGAASKLRVTDWATSYNGIITNGTDDYGFSALRSGEGDIKYGTGNVGTEAVWWTATEYSDSLAYYWSMNATENVRNWRTYKHYYPINVSLHPVYSVRCVKGQGVPPTICNGKYYNPATHFCSGGKEIYSLHNGKEYEPAICGTEKYNSATHFCTKSENTPAVFEKCGGKGYDTRTNVCVNGEVQDTSKAPRFTDARDKQKYKYVKIGKQTWMAENLNYAANGSKCLDNKITNCDIYGRLYDYGTALPGCGSGTACYRGNIGLEPQGVCPDGWHLPNDDEWFELFDFAGAGNINETSTKLKASIKLRATSGWGEYGNGTDNYGFSALPTNGNYAAFWTSYGASETYVMSAQIYPVLEYGIYTSWGANTTYSPKNSAFSVRCLKNSGTIPRCGNIGYDPKIHFCTKSPSNPELVALCGGKGYDTRTKFCKDGEVQDLPTAPSKLTFTDARNSKEYKYVKIGEQEWMAENLNFNASGSKCYSNLESNCEIYGRLYTWATANEVCPTGWHLPSKAEWTTLADVVGGEYSDGSGNKLKAISNLWETVTNPNLLEGNPAKYAGTDDYGFSALPGGSSNGSTFSTLGRSTSWWSTDVPSINPNSAYYASVDYNTTYFSANSSSYKTNLNSVRCLKD